MEKRYKAGYAFVENVFKDALASAYYDNTTSSFRMTELVTFLDSVKSMREMAGEVDHLAGLMGGATI